MRITADAKHENRRRILEVAQQLFGEKGFDEAGIRDIANEVGMAAGTLFNYFSSKEEVAVALAESAFADAAHEFARKRREHASLREDLFFQISTQLRHLRPLRKFIRPVVETALALPVPSGEKRTSQTLRGDQLEALAKILRTHGIDDAEWSMRVPIYWSLYVGVLTFWGSDNSPRQEDTLAMLDQAVNMFVTWLESNEQDNGSSSRKREIQK